MVAMLRESVRVESEPSNGTKLDQVARLIYTNAMSERYQTIFQLGLSTLVTRIMASV